MSEPGEDEWTCACGKSAFEVSLAHLMTCVMGVDADAAEDIQRGVVNRITVTGLGRCDICDTQLFDDYECRVHGRRRRQGSYAEDPA